MVLLSGGEHDAVWKGQKRRGNNVVDRKQE
jgi:hypothetical protein